MENLKPILESYEKAYKVWGDFETDHEKDWEREKEAPERYNQLAKEMDDLEKVYKDIEEDYIKVLTEIRKETQKEAEENEDFHLFEKCYELLKDPRDAVYEEKDLFEYTDWFYYCFILGKVEEMENDFNSNE